MALTAEQLAHRANGIGGSELAAIMGISPFSGPYEIWNLKVNGVDDFAGSPAANFGSMMERSIAKLLAKREGLALYTEPGPCLYHGSEWPYSPRFRGDLADHLVDGTLRSREFPHMLVTPDYLTPDTIHEIKCVGPWSGANAFSAPGEVTKYPRYYALQTQVQAFLTGAQDIVLWCGVQAWRPPDEEIAWLWASYTAGDTAQVEWWCDHYAAQYIELRRYDIPYREDEARRAGKFVEGWWAKYVETRTPDPFWRPRKRPFQYQGKREEEEQLAPEGFTGGL